MRAVAGLGVGLIVLLVAAGAGAGAPHGLGGEVLMGGQVCIPNGEADCENIDGNFGFGLSAMYRFNDYMALDFTFHYGLYDVPAGVDAHLLGILVGPRVFAPVGRWDLFAAIGVGWSEIVVEEGGAKGSIEGVAMGFALGAQYRVVDWLAFGVLMRYHLPFPQRACLYYQGQSECDDVSDEGDQSHAMMVGAVLTAYLPI